MREPVTVEDINTASHAAVEALTPAVDLDWHVPAGGLDWTCWETLEHTSDDLFSYALQLAVAKPPLDAYLPVVTRAARASGPQSAIFAQVEGGNEGLLQVLEGCASLLVGIVTIAPPQMRAFHPMGISDPEGFAAMGIVEVLVHTHDVALGLDLPWAPPADLCDRVLLRLFPAAPTEPDRWATLLWATGRGDLPGVPALQRWRWDSSVR
jgi:hypothetical protein